MITTFLDQPSLPMEITWSILCRTSPKLLYIISIGISTKCCKQNFWFSFQGCRNGPLVLFWGLFVQIWWAHHRSVMSGDVGGIWMSQGCPLPYMNEILPITSTKLQCWTKLDSSLDLQMLCQGFSISRWISILTDWPICQHVTKVLLSQASFCV